MTFTVVFTLALLAAACSGAPSPDDFPFRGASFNDTETYLMCDENHVTLTPSANVPDYGVHISAELAKLAEDGGGAVRLENGIYPVTTPIRFPSNTCLVGQSTTTVILRVPPNHVLDQDEVPNRGILHAVEKEKITVRDLTVDAGSCPGTGKDCDDKLGKFGTYFEAVSKLRIEDVHVLHACAYGIDFPGNDDEVSKDVVLRNVRVDSVGKDGIKVVRAQKVSVLRSITSNNGRHGLHIAGSSTVVVPDSMFAVDGRTGSHKGCGILVTDREGAWTSSVTITFARVLNPYRGGICLMRAKDVLIADATVTNTRRTSAPCYEVTESTAVNVVRGICKPNREKPVGSQCEGLPKSGVCCPKVCGKCGGVGCSKLAPYGACCVTKIKENGNMCADGPPPCNL